MVPVGKGPPLVLAAQPEVVAAWEVVEQPVLVAHRAPEARADRAATHLAPVDRMGPGAEEWMGLGRAGLTAGPSL